MYTQSHCLSFLLLCLFLGITHTSQAQSPTLDLTHPGRLDTATWNHKFLAMDKNIFGGKNRKEWERLPQEILPFPVIDYGHGATGCGELFLTEPFKMTCSYFLIGKHDYNQAEFPPGQTHRIFFNLLVLSDTLDTLNFTVVENYVTSRNHPDYVGEGQIKTRNMNIEYVTVHRPDQTAFAVVGTKFFDLQLGNTIVVAPQQDGSVRFMQLKHSAVYLKEVEGFLTQAVRTEPIKSFLSAPGNIRQ